MKYYHIHHVPLAATYAGAEYYEYMDDSQLVNFFTQFTNYISTWNYTHNHEKQGRSTPTVSIMY